ncbi:unnamed protein product [Urochloa decumbens]|uniref:Uncharacterized protein n=1 Tax=Urochloa decumbens TaxID=240449 RepID=A0ABC8WGR7_9POAL
MGETKKKKLKKEGTSRSEEQEQNPGEEKTCEHETSSASKGSFSPSFMYFCTGTFQSNPPPRQLYSTTARAPAKAGAPPPQCPMDSSRWNRVCFAMNASTVRRNSSASSIPQHACASRAVTDDRRRRPFSDSDRRSSGDAARRAASRGPIFSDLLRLGARASLLTRTAGLSSNAACAAGSGAAATATTSGAAMDDAGAAGAAGVAKETASSSKVLEAAGVGAAKEGKPAALVAAGAAACGGVGVAVAVSVAAELVCWLEEAERSCLESAKRRSTMALPRTKTKRALRRSEPASRSTAAAADGTREDDQERKATSARSSPARSIR